MFVRRDFLKRFGRGSAMWATVVTSLSPTCRCLISAGDHFPEILLIIFQTLLMDLRLFIDETEFCHDSHLLDFIVFPDNFILLDIFGGW